jgi:ABC-type multidrug transport system ATPase subunit
MGPSGAGKTTFLSTLMGKVDSSWKRGGTLHINGQEAKMSDFKKVRSGNPCYSLPYLI